MNLSLDTSVLIDLANDRHLAVRKAYKSTILKGNIPWICAFAAHELLYGARISRRPDHQEMVAQGILRQMRIADWTLKDAETAADLRVSLRARGRPIGSMDSLIAGQALARGWTLVTGNVREFSRVDGLKIVDWTGPVA